MISSTSRALLSAAVSWLAPMLLSAQSTPSTPPAPAAAAAPAPVQPPLPPLTDAQLHTVYSEVLACGGMQYTFYLGGRREQADADALRAKLDHAQSEAVLLRLGFKKVTYPCYVMPAALCHAVRNTARHHVSPVVQMNGSWAMAMPVSVAFVPIIAFDKLKTYLPSYVQIGGVPDPDAVSREPLASQYAAAQATNVDGLARLPPDADVDVVLPDGSTMLMDAIARNQIDFVTALLNRHANPNHCTAGYCPLQMAIIGEDPLPILRLLLDHGASVDQMDPDAGVVFTALTAAMVHAKALDAGALLLDHGANADGADGEVPPIVLAASRGNQAAVEMLLSHGADLYRLAIMQVPAHNALSEATAAKADAGFLEWLNQRWRETAKKSGRFDWQGWIEQDGKRTAIGDRAITLKRAPFDIVVSMRPGTALMVASATGRGLFDEYKRGETVSPLFSVASIGAEICDGPTRALFVNPSAGGDKGLWTTQFWSDNPSCKDFTSSQTEKGSTRYVRTIGQLFIDRTKTEIGDSNVPELDLIVGTRLDLALPYLTYFNPKQVEIRFR